MCLDVFSGNIGCPRMGVAHNHYIGPQCFKCVEGINQTLPLGYATDRSGQVYNISAQIFSCQFKGGTGAGAGFVEKGNQGLAA